MKDPYDTLDLDKKTFTQEKLRRAYRKKAARSHPDNRETGNEPEFLAVNAAHKLLADPNAKKIYDETGIVLGEDKAAEAAIMLIIGVAAEILANSPNCNLVMMLARSLEEMIAQGAAAVRSIEKSIKNVDARWTGGEAVKNAILMNLRGRIEALKMQALTQSRAKQLLKDVSYQSDETVESLVDILMARQRPSRF